MVKKKPASKSATPKPDTRATGAASAPRTSTGKASGTRAAKPKPKAKPAAKRKPRALPAAPLPGIPGQGKTDGGVGRPAPSATDGGVGRPALSATDGTALESQATARAGLTTVPTVYVVTRQADVAAFCGVSLDTVKGWAKQGMPGKPPTYYLGEIVQWLRRDGPWKPRGTVGRPARADGADVLGDDILMEGGAGSSPALEKLRAAKAALAELDLQERRGALISVERAKDVGLRWATLIKRMGERLGKRYGRDATDTVNRTLEECSRVFEAGYARPADADSDAGLVDSSGEAASHEADG